MDTNFKYAIVAGWLIFPAIGIIYSFLASLIGLFLRPAPVLDLNQWSIIIYVINILYLPLYVWIIAAWYRRRAILPKLMSYYYGSTLLFYAINLGLMYQLQVEFESHFKFNAVVTIPLTLIWLAYFNRSLRVKATFIR